MKMIMAKIESRLSDNDYGIDKKAKSHVIWTKWNTGQYLYNKYISGGTPDEFLKLICYVMFAFRGFFNACMRASYTCLLFLDARYLLKNRNKNYC